MYSSMYLLLNLTPLKYSLSAARKNYFEIISAIHPDKCSLTVAEELTQAVVQAYNTLTDPNSRSYYNYCGTPGPNIEYDNKKAELQASVINDILKEHREKLNEKAAEKQRLVREKQRLRRLFEENKITRQEYYDELHKLQKPEGEMQQGTPNLDETNEPKKSTTEKPKETPAPGGFETFLKRCQEAAMNNPAPAPEAKASKTPDAEASKTPESANVQSTSGAQPTANNVEIIDLTTDDETEVASVAGEEDNGNNKEDSSDTDSFESFKRRFLNSDDPSSSSKTPSQDKNSTTEQGEAVDHEESTTRQSSPEPTRPKYVDAATSPIKFYTKDACLSPMFKTLTCDMATSPLKAQSPNFKTPSPGANTPSASKRNLNFTSSPTGNENSSSNEKEVTEEQENKDESCSFQEHETSSTANESRRTSVHKQFIQKIHGYRMRKTADGTSLCRFKVRWGPGGYDVVEPADVVIQEKVALKDWLDLLQVNQQKKYNSIIAYHPEFLEVYKD